MCFVWLLHKIRDNLACRRGEVRLPHDFPALMKSYRLKGSKADLHAIAGTRPIEVSSVISLGATAEVVPLTTPTMSVVAPVRQPVAEVMAMMMTVAATFPTMTEKDTNQGPAMVGTWVMGGPWTT